MFSHDARSSRFFAKKCVLLSWRSFLGICGCQVLPSQFGPTPSWAFGYMEPILFSTVRGELLFKEEVAGSPDCPLWLSCRQTWLSRWLKALFVLIMFVTPRTLPPFRGATLSFLNSCGREWWSCKDERQCLSHFRCSKLPGQATELHTWFYNLFLCTLLDICSLLRFWVSSDLMSCVSCVPLGLKNSCHGHRMKTYYYC